MSLVFLVYNAAIHDGGFVSGWRGVVSGQNCPFASLHCLNCSSGMSIAFVLSYVTPRYLLFMLYIIE